MARRTLIVIAVCLVLAAGVAAAGRIDGGNEHPSTVDARGIGK